MKVKVIGTEKYALEVHRLVEISGHTMRGFVGIQKKKDSAGSLQVSIEDEFDDDESAYVIGVSDREVRAAIADLLGSNSDVRLINIIHPTVVLDADIDIGRGNIIGPYCYIGKNVCLGDFNVLSNHSSVGHHALIGSHNFMSPNFHSGNSMTIGDGNFFGVSCVVLPEAVIGDNNRFQASARVEGVIEDGRLCFDSSRLKIVNI